MVLGNQRPRIKCIPRDIQSTLGPEATDLASQSNLVMDDWQAWSLDNILGINSEHKWAAFEAAEIVGRQNGKGGILEARELAGLFIIPYEIEILHTAHEYDTAIKHFFRLIADIDANPDLSRRCRKPNLSHGQESIRLIPTPTIIMGSNGRYVRRSVTKMLEIAARTTGAGRGYTADLVVYDEAMILDALKLGATIPTLTTRPNPQIIYMASAGLGAKSSQLGELRRRGIAGDPQLFFGEWSNEPHDEYCSPDCTKHIELGTPESYANANPALGIRTTLDYLGKERRALPESEWLRERMGVGVYPAAKDGWLVIPKTWWNATKDGSPEPVRVTGPVFAIDATPDRGSAAIAVAGLRPDGLAGLQVIEHHAGTGWVVKRAKEIDDRWHPAKWIVDRRSAAGSLIADLEKAGLPVQVIGATDVSHACGQLFDGFRDDLIRHYGQPALESALAGADWRKLLESRAFDRVNSGTDISPLMAVTFAYWGFLMFGQDAETDVRDSVHWDISEIIRIYKAGVYGPDDIRRFHDSGLIDDSDLEKLANAGIHI